MILNTSNYARSHNRENLTHLPYRHRHSLTLPTTFVLEMGRKQEHSFNAVRRSLRIVSAS